MNGRPDPASGLQMVGLDAPAPICEDGVCVIPEGVEPELRD